MSNNTKVNNKQTNVYKKNSGVGNIMSLFSMYILACLKKQNRKKKFPYL